MGQDKVQSGISSSPAAPIIKGSHNEHGVHDHASAEPMPVDHKASAPHLAKDVVCGMTVDMDTTAHRAKYQGQT